MSFDTLYILLHSVFEMKNLIFAVFQMGIVGFCNF